MDFFFLLRFANPEYNTENSLRIVFHLIVKEKYLLSRKFLQTFIVDKESSFILAMCGEYSSSNSL